MEYKAQLVIRSRERNGVGIIDRIKELASESNRTYSEMALKLLEIGLAHYDADADASPANPEPASSAPAKPTDSDKKPATPAAKSNPRPQSKATSQLKAKKPAKTSATKKASEADAVAQKIVENIEADDLKTAGHALANFFAKAGPIQGGQIKNALEANLDKEAYERLLKNLRKTKEYRSYRQRVIFER